MGVHQTPKGEKEAMWTLDQREGPGDDKGQCGALPRPHPELADYSELLHLWSHKFTYSTPWPQLPVLVDLSLAPTTHMLGTPRSLATSIYTRSVFISSLSLLLLSLCCLESICQHPNLNLANMPNLLVPLTFYGVPQAEFLAGPINSVPQAHYNYANNQAPHHWGKSHHWAHRCHYKVIVTNGNSDQQPRQASIVSSIVTSLQNYLKLSSLSSSSWTCHISSYCE